MRLRVMAVYSAWPYADVIEANDGGRRNDDVIDSWLANTPSPRPCFRNALGGVQR